MSVLKEELDSLDPAVQHMILEWLSADQLSQADYERFTALHGTLSGKLYRKLDRELKKRV